MITSLGKYLRKLRIERDMKLLDLAKKTHMSVSYISAVETGRKAASDDFVRAMSLAFDLSKEQVKEVVKHANETKKEIRLNLNNVDSSSRDLATAFARRFENLNTEEKDAVLRILNKETHERK